MLMLFASSILASPLPDDTALHRLVLGTWNYLPPQTFRADGTWTSQNRSGRWKIEHGRLIKTWRDAGDTTDWRAVDEIIELTPTLLRLRPALEGAQPGRTPFPIMSLRRVPLAEIAPLKSLTNR
jgi:hypothetical protein